MPKNVVVAALLPLFAGCAGGRPAAVEPPGRFAVRALPVLASLRGLAVVDANVVWVGGSSGALWRTIDGGTTWTNVAPPGCRECDFRDLEAFDRDCALAMVAGQPARVYRTSDGGQSWAIVHEDPRREAFFDAMAFRGARGVLFGDPCGAGFTVLATDDAGVTWRPLLGEQVPPPRPGEAGFAASGTCVGMAADGASCWIATGGGACRFLSVDLRGVAPRAVDLPLAAGGASCGAFSLAFEPGAGLDGVAVGGDYQNPEQTLGTAAWTTDGGRTWQAAAGGAGGYRSAVLWLDDALLAVGSHGASWSRDRGRTWHGFGGGFHALAKGRDGSVFAVGSEGRVGRWIPRIPRLGR